MLEEYHDAIANDRWSYTTNVLSVETLYMTFQCYRRVPNRCERVLDVRRTLNLYCWDAMPNFHIKALFFTKFFLGGRVDLSVLCDFCFPLRLCNNVYLRVSCKMFVQQCMSDHLKGDFLCEYKTIVLFIIVKPTIAKD